MQLKGFLCKIFLCCCLSVDYAFASLNHILIGETMKQETDQIRITIFFGKHSLKTYSDHFLLFMNSSISQIDLR